MKKIIVLFLLLFISRTYAAVGHKTKKEMVEDSEFIAIVEIIKEEQSVARCN